MAQDFARFLEALVGELGEGDVGAGCEGGAAATGADGVLVLGGQEFLFHAGGVDEIGVVAVGRCCIAARGSRWWRCFGS